MGNPIKYSDLVIPDSSITDLIAQLQELQKTYAQMQSDIVNEAKTLREGLQNVSGATKEGSAAITEGAKKADELEQAMKRLSKAQSETAETIAAFNAKLKEQNQLNALSARIVLSEEGSYNQLSATLAKLKLQYQQMGEAQRKSTEGGDIRKQIADTAGQIKAYNLELQKSIKLQEAKARRDSSAVGSYNRLAAVYDILKMRLNAMGEATEKDAAAKRKMEEAAKAVYAQMIKLQEATGKHTLSVGNYAKSWDGLRFSVFQVMREIPNAAMSMQTFFLAISNNLPIVADEIGRVREENKKLQAEGKPTTSVFKQITNAVLSWQTAMVMGIFLLTKFGTAIIDWVGKLFTGRKAVMSYTEAIDAMNKEMAESGTEFGKNMVAYKRLQAEWKNTSSEKERVKWIKQHKTELEQLTTKVKDVSSAEDFFVNNTANVIKGFEYRAKAAAAATLAQKEYEKAFKIQVENSRKTGTGADLSWWQKLGLGASGMNADMAAAAMLKDAGAEMRTAEANAQQFTNMSATFDKLAADILGDPHHAREAKGKTGRHGRDPRDITKDIEQMIRDVNQALSESETALMGEGGIDKKISIIEDKVQKSINSMENMRGRIKNWLSNPKKFKLTKQQEESLKGLYELIDATIGNMRTRGGVDTANARTEYAAQQAAFEARMQRLAMEGMAGQSLKAAFEYRQRIIEAEQNSELKALENTYKLRQDLIDAGDKDELERQEKYLRERELLIRKYDTRQAALNFEYYNAAGAHSSTMARLQFAARAVSPSRRQQLRFNYDQSRAALERETANPATSPQRRQEIAAQMQANAQQFAKDNKAKNIYELMGLELNDKDMAAIDAGKQYAMDAMNSLMQLEQAWADKAVENAQRRVDATRNALQIEKEARANGYANNVEYAQKEYEAAKKQQEKALRQRAKVQKAMIAIQTAEQISSLVTASAQIWRTMSEMSQPWLAPAMIGLMWASFAASKVMAAKMADVQNDKEEYAEGTVELLQGGSHASGNDVDLGTKPNGVRRRAEGGEYFAVINRRNSRKYRHQIPDIINALNRGDFDKRYMSAEQAANDLGKYVAAYDKAGNITLKYERNATDLRRLEDDVRKLREQGEHRTAVDGRGNVIEYYKNVRRVIRG